MEISKTTDGEDFVITMAGPSAHMGKDGFEKDACSLWLHGGKLDEILEVSDFTN